MFCMFCLCWLIWLFCLICLCLLFLLFCIFCMFKLRCRLRVFCLHFFVMFDVFAFVWVCFGVLVLFGLFGVIVLSRLF